MTKTSKTLKLISLKNEGRLSTGDVIETSDHGRCSVVFIKSKTKILIRDSENQLIELSFFVENVELIGA